MRVHWVTPYWPSPQRGAGDVLLFELIRLAAQSHSIHVIFAEPNAGARDEALDALDVTYEGVGWPLRPAPSSRLQLAWRLLVRDGDGALFQPGRTVALREAIKRKHAADRPDLVVLTHGELAPLLSACRAPSALLLFDLYSRQMQQEAALSRRARGRLMYSLAHRRLARWESRLYARADAVACNSPVDASELGSMIRRPVDVVKNVVGDDYFEPHDRPRRPLTVTFVAHLGYRPNLDAVQWLTRAIWPQVVAAIPEAELRIVGFDPARQVLEAASRVGASVHASVPDVRPFYWESAVTVAPVRLGSGIRNKVLHAMACSAPVVATDAAVEGLDVQHGEHLLIANDEARFANAIIETLSDPRSASARASTARAYVETYRVQAVSNALDHWWQRAVRA